MRFAGTDPWWAGTFAQLIAHLGPPPSERFVRWLTELGLGDLLALAARRRADGSAARLASLDIRAAFTELWDELRALQAAL